jgi:hypothetical protein
MLMTEEEKKTALHTYMHGQKKKEEEEEEERVMC